MDAKKKRKSPPQSPPEPVRAPFTLLVDGREKAPYQFQGMRADAVQRGAPLVVPWQWAHLQSGDYSILGYSDRVSIERKSKADLYSTLGQHRDRFEREHERLSRLDFAAVVIEATWEDILSNPPERSRLLPKTIFRTALSWYARYGVAWFTLGSRRLAEITTYRLLEKWWFAHQLALSESSGVCRYCGRPLTDPASVDCGIGPYCRRVKLRDPVCIDDEAVAVAGVGSVGSDSACAEASYLRRGVVGQGVGLSTVDPTPIIDLTGQPGGAVCGDLGDTEDAQVVDIDTAPLGEKEHRHEEGIEGTCRSNQTGSARKMDTGSK